MTANTPLPPPWFKKEAYIDASKLDFEGWSTQLSNRIVLHWALKSGELHWFFDERFKLLQDAPFFDLELPLLQYVPEMTIAPLTFGQLAILESFNDDNPLEFFASCDEKIKDNNPQLYGLQAHITLNLSASISELRDDFEKLLPTLLERNRNLYPRDRESRITTSKIKGWAKNQMLPYIDLHLWHLRNGIKMPSRRIVADWLMTEEGGGQAIIEEMEEEVKGLLLPGILRRLAVAR